MYASTQFLYGRDTSNNKPFILANPNSCDRYATSSRNVLNYTTFDDPNTPHTVNVPSKTLQIYRNGPSTVGAPLYNGKFTLDECRLPKDSIIYESPLRSLFADGLAVKVNDEYFVGAIFADDNYNVYDKHLGLTYDPYIPSPTPGLRAFSGDTELYLECTSNMDAPEYFEDHLFYRLPGSNGTWPASAIMASFEAVAPLNSSEPPDDEKYNNPVVMWQISGPKIGVLTADLLGFGARYSFTNAGIMSNSNETYGNSDWPDRIPLPALDYPGADSRWWHVPQAAWNGFSHTDDADYLNLKDADPLIDWETAISTYDEWTWSVGGKGYGDIFYFKDPNDIWWSNDGTRKSDIGKMSDGSRTILVIHSAEEETEFNWKIFYEVVSEATAENRYGLEYYHGVRRTVHAFLDDIPNQAMKAFLAGPQKMICKTGKNWMMTCTPTQPLFDSLYAKTTDQVGNRVVTADITQKVLDNLIRTGCEAVLVATNDRIGTRSQFHAPHVSTESPRIFPLHVYLTMFSTISFPKSLISAGKVLKWTPLYSHLSYLSA